MSSGQCKAKTASGKPCRMAPVKGRRYCFNHDPKQARARAVARKHGGERARIPHAGNAGKIAKQPKDLNEARSILDYTLAEILAHENSIARGRLLVSLYEAYVKHFEVGELEARIMALEQAVLQKEEHHDA